MSIASEPARRLTAKLNGLLDHIVTVVTTDGKTYTGKLTGFDPATLALAIEGVKDSSGSSWPLIIIGGSRVAEIRVGESEVFDAREFADFLAKYGNIDRSQIRVVEDANIVEVARNVVVSRDGVKGSGPLAQKVYTFYREYLRTKGAVVS